MKFRGSPVRPVRYTEPTSTFASEVPLVPDSRNRLLVDLEARGSRLADTASGALYRVLSGCVRRLYGEVQTASSLYGYIDCDRGTGLTRAASGSRNISGKPGPRKENTVSAEPNLPTGQQSSVEPGALYPASQLVDPWKLLQRTVSWLPRLSLTWLGFAYGICSAAAVGTAIVLLFRSSFAQFVITAPAIFTFAILASCAIVWIQLQLAVHRSTRRIYQLLADLSIQHKLAGETVRWIQELEVTFKAFTGDLAKVDQAFGGVSPSVTPCKVGYDQGPDCSSQRPHEVSVRGPPYCEDIPCRQNGEDRGRRPGRPNCSLLKEPCAWHLRLRFYQVLDWQHRIFSYLYDDIVRWEPTRQLAWKDQISQGPWGRAETSSCGTSQFDGNLGALKEMTARSWRLHSRFLGGIHVSLRHMLFSLNARFLRAEFDVKRKVGGFTAAASPLIPKGTPTRYVSRVLKQALQDPQQYHSPSGCGKSLHEEIHKAATVGGGRGGYDQIFKRRPQKHGSSYTLCPQSIANRPTSAPEPAGPAVAMTEKAAPENSVHCNWVWALFKALGVGVFSGCAVLGAVADGIRALLWLYGRVHQLGIVLSAAGHVASEAANALWMILEEDWASSPFLLPQPLWGGGMRERGETPNKLTEADAEAQKLPRFAVSPPRFGSDCGGTLFKIVSDKHRSALATMSRNVAASLALLRIPATAHGRHFKCPENILSIWRKSRSASNSGQCSMNTGGAVYLSWLNHRTAAEEGQEAEGAELLGILPLILRHLRTASEEGEKLERSLRFTEEKVESFQNCTIARTSEDLPVQPSERDLHSEEPEQPLQATISEPVQCFEIYTAVGQDSLTNKCRFQEEEGVKEAFAEGDPAVRERSQITLRELELRLKRKERERQCIPRVLKELSVVAADSADGCESGKAEDGAVVRLVTRGSGEACSCSPPESPTTSRASSVGGDTQNDQEVVAPGSYVTGDLNAQEALHQGCVGVSPVQAKHTVLEALSQPQETCIFPDVDIIDNEQAAFRICREKFKGPSTRGVAFMPETLVTQSLMSQLRGVLKSQKRTHTVLTSTEASSGTHQGSNSVTFGDCIADEEWSACDVVEGPSCAGEIPTWVEAPSDSGDSGVVSPKGQGRSSMQYPDGGTTGESGCPVDGSPSCPSGNG